MSNYLFLFTIGPVQSFIAQARKTHDLYIGSKILSDLITDAIEYVKKELKEIEIIFPAKDVESKPNRFLAKIEKSDNESIKKIGKELEDSVKKEFKKIAEKCLEPYLKNQTKPKNFDNFDKQIEQFLQIFWVAKEIKDENYQENYDQIESLLGSVKNLRKFEQLAEVGRKCSLCGERNVLFYKGFDDKNIKKNGEEKSPYIQSDAINIEEIEENKYKFTDKEGLCAVCFTKRMYNPSTTEIALKHPISEAEQIDKKEEEENISSELENIERQSFPSTAEIALKYTMTEIKSEIEDDKELDKMLKLNYQLAYEDNLTTDFFEKNNIPKKKLSSYQNINRNLKKRCKDKKLHLSKYYAMIMFDGDSMGKWLSGEYLGGESKLANFHNDFSEFLGKYANWAKEYLDGDRGRAIYAGGDDFLGFINLYYLFDVLKELREKFKELVNDKLKDQYILSDNYKDKEITFSAGIVIAHYKTPLSEVLNWTRKMEQKAKNIDDTKNRFSIAVLKRSGEINKSCYHWYYEKNDDDSKNKNDDKEYEFILNCMKDIVYLLKTKKLSNTFIKVLNREFEKLMDKDFKIELSDDLLESEIKRLFNRSITTNLKKESYLIREKLGNTRTFLIGDLLIERGDFQNFLHFLNIADFIAREFPISFIKKEESNNE